MWPSVEGEQQIQTHLDLAVDDVPSAVGWPHKLGAVLAEFQPQEHLRMLDPVEHRLRVFEQSQPE